MYSVTNFFSQLHVNSSQLSTLKENEEKDKKRMIEKVPLALAGWLKWLEHCPVPQRVVDSIPGQGTSPGCGFDLFEAHMGGNQSMFLSYIGVSLSLSFPSSPSKIYKLILRWGLKKKKKEKKIYHFTCSWPCTIYIFLLEFLWNK